MQRLTGHMISIGFCTFPFCCASLFSFSSIQVSCSKKKQKKQSPVIINLMNSSCSFNLIGQALSWNAQEKFSFWPHDPIPCLVTDIPNGWWKRRVNGPNLLKGGLIDQPLISIIFVVISSSYAECVGRLEKEKNKAIAMGMERFQGISLLKA